MMTFPNVIDPELVGFYPAVVKAGGGFVWDEVLEYRVWCHPENGSEDIEDGNDYYYAFAGFQEAMTFHHRTLGSEEPLVLILQKEHINEPSPGVYEHVKIERLTEWPVKFLTRPRQDRTTILNFLSPGAPGNRLDIIRGIAVP